MRLFRNPILVAWIVLTTLGLFIADSMGFFIPYLLIVGAIGFFIPTGRKFLPGNVIGRRFSSVFPFVSLGLLEPPFWVSFCGCRHGRHINFQMDRDIFDTPQFYLHGQE